MKCSQPDVTYCPRTCPAGELVARTLPGSLPTALPAAGCGCVRTSADIPVIRSALESNTCWCMDERSLVGPTGLQGGDEIVQILAGRDRFRTSGAANVGYLAVIHRLNRAGEMKVACVAVSGESDESGFVEEGVVG